ncbi:hypothetical protein ACFVT2_31995 [Streptomyces sp. NPDC058000]|uniref:hypothetical protein n=1 Tax=Streptomyces sp. NPDC058000 TaxID=3346299 RepID=UPI0036F12B6A
MLLVVRTPAPGTEAGVRSRWTAAESDRGRERTAGEFEALLTRSGCRLDRVVPTRSVSAVVEVAEAEAEAV